MIKRQKRDKISKKELDMTKPLDISKIGTKEDPCFGKHHDPSVSECQRCGDIEICSILSSQRLHIVREIQEKEKRFKDIEKLETKKVKTINQVILDKLQSIPKKRLSLRSIAKFIKDNTKEHNQSDILLICKAIRKMVKSSSLFELIKIQDKTFIKIK